MIQSKSQFARQGKVEMHHKFIVASLKRLNRIGETEDKMMFIRKTKWLVTYISKAKRLEIL